MQMPFPVKVDLLGSLLFKPARQWRSVCKAQRPVDNEEGRPEVAFASWRAAYSAAPALGFRSRQASASGAMTSKVETSNPWIP